MQSSMLQDLIDAAAFNKPEGRRMRPKRFSNHLTASLRALALLMLLPTICRAGGFGLNEFGARGNAMGGAVIALPADASTVAYNPAGMTDLAGTNVMVGVTAIAPTADVKVGVANASTLKPSVYFPPHAYLTTQLSDRTWFGVGIYTRFGLGTQYDSNWPGARNTYNAVLSSYSIAPNLALKITDNLSIAFGPELLISEADLRNHPSPTSDMKLKVDGMGIGFQLAAYYKFNEQWSAGFTYHSTQHHTDRGKANFSGPLPFPLVDQSVSISLDLPASYSLGLAYKPTKSLKFEADVTFTQWQDYNKMLYEFEYWGTRNSLKYWRNVWRFQLGTEYMATDWLALRAGFVWDQDPMRKGYEDYMLPANDRQIYSVGFGILDGKMTYDFSLMYLMNDDRTMSPGNTLTAASKITNSRAYMAGFSFGYKF